ncbi:class I tRNA ligase family protein, partial [uncultured Desulfovibrio sp.]
MQLYNTLGRRKEEFIPVRPGKAHIYVCGITSYDYCHIGHARSAIVFDILVRQLRHLGLEVLFVRNFTDVDDKIIRRAESENRDWREIAATYMAAFHEDMDRLGVLRADLEPRATESIPQIQELCSRLIAAGKAYATPGGDVYFRVRAYAPYGRLSRRS